MKISPQVTPLGKGESLQSNCAPMRIATQLFFRQGRLDLAQAIFSALIHNLDHISTACAQPGSFFLLRQLGLSGTLQNAP